MGKEKKISDIEYINFKLYLTTLKEPQTCNYTNCDLKNGSKAYRIELISNYKDKFKTIFYASKRLGKNNIKEKILKEYLVRGI